MVTINGYNINYEKIGNGKTTIVLLHGWGTDLTSLSGIASNLSEAFTVYSFDFIGFGKSSPPNQPMEVGDYAKIWIEIFRKLEIINPILLGHSFGGRVIIYMTGKLGLNSKKNILVDSAGIKPKRSFLSNIRLYSYKFSRKIVSAALPKEKSEQIIGKMRKKRGSADYNNATPIMRETLVKVVNEDLRHYLKNIHSPTLLMWGKNDIDTPVEDAKIMEKLIPDCGLVLFEGAGHYSFLDRPYEFNRVLNEFLKPERESGLVSG